MKMIFRRMLVLVCLLLIMQGAIYAQSIKVAVAANLQSVINVLGKDFQQKTNLTIEPIIGSSGKLVAQISNGAPYDVFLSADMNFPQKLTKDGFASQQPSVYALGKLIICTTQQNFDLKHWNQLLVSDKVDKIALANASIAPYGRAAEESLQKLNLLNKVKSKIVYGESIAQVNTYITTGVVTLGFTSQSLVLDPANTVKLSWHLVDPKTYAPIEQGMVLINRRDANPSAVKFYRYMLSAPAKNILKKYGYSIP